METFLGVFVKLRTMEPKERVQYDSYVLPPSVPKVSKVTKNQRVGRAQAGRFRVGIFDFRIA